MVGKQDENDRGSRSLASTVGAILKSTIIDQAVQGLPVSGAFLPPINERASCAFSVIRDQLGSLSFAPNNNGERARLQFERRLGEWRQVVLQRLPDGLGFNGPVKLDVLRPQLFYAAYRQGLKALFNSALYYGIMRDLRQTGTVPGAAHALIVPDRSSEQARNYTVFVYAQEKDELLLARGRSTFPFESAQEARVDLALLLQAVGIEDVTVLEGTIGGWHTEAAEGGELRETRHFITLPGNHTVH